MFSFRKIAFKSARVYFSIALLLLAMYLTSFIASYLLPAAIVAFFAAIAFLTAGLLWHKPPKNTGPSDTSPPPRTELPTPTDSTIRRLGEPPASSS